MFEFDNIVYTLVIVIVGVFAYLIITTPKDFEYKCIETKSYVSYESVGTRHGIKHIYTFTDGSVKQMSDLPENGLEKTVCIKRGWEKKDK